MILPTGWPTVFAARSIAGLPNTTRTQRVRRSNNSAISLRGARFATGKRFILAANFRSGRVDVFDTNFNQVRLDDDAFDDDRVREGFAPFNVQAIGPKEPQAVLVLRWSLFGRVSIALLCRRWCAPATRETVTSVLAVAAPGAR